MGVTRHLARMQRGGRGILAAGGLALGACGSEVVGAPGEQSTGAAGADPGGPLTTYEAKMAVAKIDPGKERTECITRRLSNTSKVLVRRFRAALGEGSHHLIVYKSTSTNEMLEPVPCGGFSGLLEGDHPIFIAQQAQAELAFPTEAGVPVALEIGARQMVRLEMHYVNTGSKPLDVAGSILLDTLPSNVEAVRSDFAFWGTTVFNPTGSPPGQCVPAMGKGDTGAIYQQALAGSKSFAATTHQHRLGVRMRIWHTDDATGLSPADAQLVVDGKLWSDPPLVVFDPPLAFADTGGKWSNTGFTFRCEWANTNDKDACFGESFYDEMCFMWHYYYPSAGFNLCVDGYCL
jgi:hypothetical protein